MQVGNASQLGTWRRSSTEILHRLPVLCPQPHSWVPQADSRLPQDPLKGALGHTALTGEGNSHPSFFPAITEEGGGGEGRGSASCSERRGIMWTS